MKSSVSFAADVMGLKPPKEIQLLSHQYTEHFHQSLGEHQDVFWQM